MVTTYHPPGGPGIRVDSLLYSGCSVTAFYDGLVSKIIAKGNTRNECIMRLNRALDEYVIEGIETIDKIALVATGSYGPHQDVPKDPIIINEVIIE